MLAAIRIAKSTLLFFLTTLNLDQDKEGKKYSFSGAFGHAVLYRRHMDNQMVVIKEVHIAELGATERQLALNEVQVLASLNHPNIIRFALHE
jgi:serine/threonine protein kinase